MRQLESPERVDRDTSRELYERHRARLYLRCRLLLKDDDAANDAVQEVFLKVLDHGDAFHRASQPAAWLSRIATNHCLNVIRMNRNKTRQAVADGHIEVASPRALWNVDQAERSQTVRQILGRMSEECAQVGIHYFVHEMSREEIGEAVGRSLPTVRKRLREFLEVAGRELGVSPPEKSAAVV
jgi:RNA polymerase sigma factor (sigma-70 family)